MGLPVRTARGVLAAAPAVTSNPNAVAGFVLPQDALPNETLSGRWQRRPKHKFQIRQKPYDIQPFMIAPVLPGETLKHLRMQARAVTDPIKNPLTGWWMEYFFFYVKHTDLVASAADITAMHLTNDALALADATAREHNYKFGTDSVVDWVKLCTEEVVKWYFRDDGEALGGYTAEGVRNTSLYKARVDDMGWFDSAKIEDVNTATDSDLPGELTQLPPHMAAFQTYYDQWVNMREKKLTAATFEDYLATFGVTVPREDKEAIRKPELLRMIRDYTYPSNTIDPSDGTPRSAASWAIAERSDKAFAFNSPGFIIGLCVARPKVYMRNQIRTAVTMLDDAYGWLPAIMRNDPYTSLVEYDHNEGPWSGIPNSADDYWVDRRDLFLYGDQFINYDARLGGAADDETFASMLLPSSSGDNVLNFHYATDTDIQNLFVDDDGSSLLDQVRQDGVVHLQILGKQHDWT